MKHLQARSLFLALLLPGAALALTSGDLTSRGSDYALADESAFEQGCFAPCECPIFELRGLGGRFTLVPSGTDGGFLAYQVSGVDWAFVRGETVVRARGDGTYRWGGEPPLQQLVLDLSIDGGTVTRFDSGLVPVTAPFPRIAVAVSMNGFYCYDEVFAIQARPMRAASAPTDPVLPLGPAHGLGAAGTITTWGAIKDRYR
jgi:hypothetical protein